MPFYTCYLTNCFEVLCRDKYLEYYHSFSMPLHALTCPDSADMFQMSLSPPIEALITYIEGTAVLEPVVPGHDEGVLLAAVPHVLGVGGGVAVHGAAVSHHTDVAAAPRLYLAYHGVGVDDLVERQPQLLLLGQRDVLDVLVPVDQPVVLDVEEDEPRVLPDHDDGQGQRHRAVQVNPVHPLYLHAGLYRDSQLSSLTRNTDIQHHQLGPQNLRQIVSD